MLERLGCADPAKGAFFPWDEVKDWPAGALDELVANGLLQPTQPASAIECDGCEDNCINKPVVVYPAQEDKPGRAFITCDKRDNIGRVRVDFRRMEQWQATGGLIASTLARLLELSQPSNAADGGQWRIGTLKGRKHNSQVTLLAGDSTTLALAGHTVPLVDVLTIEKNSLALDKAALIRLVDNPADKSETETPEARKARLIARVNQEKAKGTKPFLKIVAEEEGFDVSRLKQIIYDYPKAKPETTPANLWADLQIQQKRTSSKSPKTKY